MLAASIDLYLLRILTQCWMMSRFWNREMMLDGKYEVDCSVYEGGVVFAEVKWLALEEG
jgi:hypothetical protein